MAKAIAALLLRGSMWVLQMMVMMVARADCVTARTTRPWYLRLSMTMVYTQYNVHMHVYGTAYHCLSACSANV
jgi:hypothetical protein